MTPDTAPGLVLAASVARSRAKLIRSGTKGGSAAAIGLEDLAAEYERMARRAEARAAQPDLLAAE
ncbi:hypothetical protein [Azospirillum picis]|uniref:Uncharacterized protein n=1 Tax=Azospirillum picis TaxID=488438 RepID=A0ABU0MPI6_9PROT|nr:hypothetical protein [Azospirillum picis]MBP2301550.1 hypothetical protein [Azospirillum picis]MDQ0535382.1 hypothetical protein [Azospirillum picis]